MRLQRDAVKHGAPEACRSKVHVDSRDIFESAVPRVFTKRGRPASW
jgi:hypothetical protein